MPTVGSNPPASGNAFDPERPNDQGKYRSANL
jgi:hypothetical protein